uniref:DExH14 plug domain-containing protein n=1 Tax=Brassica oleracea var. oleracea TaxID=109376 RepID=A0A0D3BH74_BRAOL
MSADRKGKTNGSTGEAKKLTIEDLFIKTCLNTLASEENTNREHQRRFEIVRVYMKKFIGAIMELVDWEVLSKECDEVTFTENRLFGKAVEQEESDIRDQSPTKLKRRTTRSYEERSFSPTLSKRIQTTTHG